MAPGDYRLLAVLVGLVITAVLWIWSRVGGIGEDEDDDDR